MCFQIDDAKLVNDVDKWLFNKESIMIEMDILSRQFDNQGVTTVSPHYLYKWNIRLGAVFSGKNALFQGKNVVERDNKWT